MESDHRQLAQHPHADRKTDVPIKQVVADIGPIAMVHQGSVTDALFRSGKSQQVHDFVKKVHDAGMLAGVSSHCPANIKPTDGVIVGMFPRCSDEVAEDAQCVRTFGVLRGGVS